MSKHFPTFAAYTGKAAGLFSGFSKKEKKEKKEKDNVKEKEKKAKKKRQQKGNPLFFRFSTTDRIIFTKRLGMILRSGLPIMQGLHMLKDEARSRSGTHIFGHLADTVEQGQPLSFGLRRFEREFGSFGINIIRVGEASGTLHENLEYLADELKRKQALRRKVLGALIYPALITVATIGIVVMLTVFIFPKILPIFAGVNATLPLSTRILIAISSFLSVWGWWLLGGLAVLFVAYLFALRLKPFHLLMDRILLRIPLFGKLSRDYNLTNLARTLSLLLKSGAPIVPAMELVADSTKNLAYRESLMEAREQILHGQQIAQQFRGNDRLYPPILVQMVSVGETTGSLTTTLDFLSDMYEEEIDEFTKNLTTLIEPVLMIVMGVIVGFIAISIITPIYSITQSLSPR